MALSCNICAKQFSRVEHLAKHKDVHIQQKHIKCGYCGKKFGRKDSAKRHEQLHIKSMDTDYELCTSLCRTCSACAKSRIKCSGGTPCRHCETRSLDCVYLARKRKVTQYRQHEELQTEDTRLAEGFGDVGRSPESNILRTRTRPCSGQSDQQEVSSRDDVIAQYGHDQSFISEPQWVERSLATNWLPFNGPMNLGFMLSSPDTMQSSYHPGAPTIPNVIGERDAETINEFEGHSGSPSLVSKQHDCVSALIDSMGVTLQSSAEHPDSHDRNASRPLTQQSLLYADGAGFRLSQADRCIRERIETYAASGPSDDSGGTTWLSMFTRKVSAMEQEPESRYDIPEDIFQDIVSRLCPRLGPSLLSGELLAVMPFLLKRSAFSFLSKLYLTNFHKLYPFVDRSLLSIPIWGWSLTLAVVAIGTRYTGLSELVGLGEELCMVIYELLTKEVQFGRAQDSLPYIQARLLVTISLCHSNQAHLLKCGYSALTLVTNACLQMRLLDEDDRLGASQQGQSLEQIWIAWRFRETRRRTGCFIWLTDCLLGFATENPPTLPPQRLRLKLPSADILWEAESAQRWLALATDHNASEGSAAFHLEESVRESIQDATQKLWRGGITPDMMTQFSTFIVLNMLLRRRWDISHYLADSMSTADSSSAREPALANPRDVGEIPAYIRWRNRTCDCLDVLHWEALSTSTKARAFETPVFLHLHLARLVILAPVRELLDHVSVVIQPDAWKLLPHNLYHFSDPTRDWSRISRTWAQQDQFKARLAVIHAGSILWHTRRFSAAAFIEPYTVYLATLVLWAFGMAPKTSIMHSLNQPAASFDQHTNLRGTAAADGLSDSGPGREAINGLMSGCSTQSKDVMSKGSRVPGSIQLDRPMDDELVQHFIRSGNEMRLCLEGVDNLCSEGGSRQILHEGVALLLAEPRTWTIAEGYASTLAALAAMSTVQ